MSPLQKCLTLTLPIALSLSAKAVPVTDFLSDLSSISPINPITTDSGCAIVEIAYQNNSNDGDAQVGWNSKNGGGVGFNGGPQPMMDVGDEHCFTVSLSETAIGGGTFNLQNGWEAGDYTVTVTGGGIIDTSNVTNAWAGGANIIGDGTSIVTFDSPDGSGGWNGTFDITGSWDSITVCQAYNPDRTGVHNLDNAAGLGFVDGSLTFDKIPEPSAAFLLFSLLCSSTIRRKR